MSRTRSKSAFVVVMSLICLLAPYSFSQPINPEDLTHYVRPLTMQAEVWNTNEDGWEVPFGGTEFIRAVLRAGGDGGFWIYPMIHLYLIEPDQFSDPVLWDKYQLILRSYGFLRKSDISDFGAQAPANWPAFEMPWSQLSTAVQLALGTGSAPAGPDQIRQTWQPIVNAPFKVENGSRVWKPEASVWAANGTPFPYRVWWAQTMEKMSPAGQPEEDIVNMEVVRDKILDLMATNAGLTETQIEKMHSGLVGGDYPDVTWLQLMKEVGMRMDIQFLGLIDGQTQGQVAIGDEDNTPGLPGLASNVLPRIAWSGALSFYFFLPRDDSGSEKMYVDDDDPTLAPVGGLAKLRLRSVTPPVMVRYFDDTGMMHVESLVYVSPGVWAIPIAAGITTGTVGSISVIASSFPFESLLGGLEPWAQLFFTVLPF